jgi:hypothetical protein
MVDAGCACSRIGFVPPCLDMAFVAARILCRPALGQAAPPPRGSSGRGRQPRVRDQGLPARLGRHARPSPHFLFELCACVFTGAFCLQGTNPFIECRQHLRGLVLQETLFQPARDLALVSCREFLDSSLDFGHSGHGLTLPSSFPLASHRCMTGYTFHRHAALAFVFLPSANGASGQKRANVWPSPPSDCPRCFARARNRPGQGSLDFDLEHPSSRIIS